MTQGEDARINVYLSAGYGRRAEMQERARELEALGLRCCARWVTEPSAADGVPDDLVPQEVWVHEA